MPRFNIHPMADLLGQLAPNQRVIGLDPGARRIGVALSDVRRRLASPYGTILRAKLSANAAEITALAAKEGAAALIVGLPLDDDGRLGPAAQAARDWTRALTEATGLPAALWDETLTTFDATAALIAADLSRARRAAVIDRAAAARMLQSALDSVPRTGQDSI
jgi:putative Holliday junction resolvase